MAGTSHDLIVHRRLLCFRHKWRRYMSLRRCGSKLSPYMAMRTIVPSADGRACEDIALVNGLFIHCLCKITQNTRETFQNPKIG